MKDSIKKPEAARALKGEFTAEAALLMAVILPVLAALLLAGFYIHDRTMMQGAACEIAAMGSNLRLYDDKEGALQERKNTLASQGSLWTEGIKGNCRVSEEAAAAEYTGSFPVPGITAGLLLRGKASMQASWNRKLYRHTDMIRIVRGIKYVVDLVEDES
ncbi:MAG: hypothetical protein K6C06_03310 [Lachnospiraceae bacterium]|nr:hypothetical protein [Lachnospiraceae bacterium]